MHSDRPDRLAIGWVDEKPWHILTAVHRERLWPIIARRATAAIYRTSRRHHIAQSRASELIDAQSLLPEPRLDEHVAVYLCHRLPSPMVRLLGVGGLLAIAKVLAWPIRLGEPIARRVLRTPRYRVEDQSGATR